MDGGIKLQNVIFSEEMMINLKPDGQLTEWRKESEKWRPECLGYVACNVKTNLKVMVLGCICYSGTGMLAFIDKENNAPAHKSREPLVWKERDNIPVCFLASTVPRYMYKSHRKFLITIKRQSKVQILHDPQHK